MQYMLLIYTPEEALAQLTKEAGAELMRDFMTFTQEIRDSGHHIAGDALQSIRTATTVRVRDNKTTTTDGPFAETREQLGGYYVVEAKHLDEALKIAARIPTAKLGSIEVRPLVESYDEPHF